MSDESSSMQEELEESGWATDESDGDGSERFELLEYYCYGAIGLFFVVLAIGAVLMETPTSFESLAEGAVIAGAVTLFPFLIVIATTTLGMIRVELWAAIFALVGIGGTWFVFFTGGEILPLWDWLYILYGILNLGGFVIVFRMT